jgi:deazaflavin-dependent oxidoreductase (nitroreductase family)
MVALKRRDGGLDDRSSGQGQMAERPTTVSPANRGAGEERASAIRDAARAEAPKHRRLLRSGRDGRILSALMLPLFWPRAPAGFAVLTTTGRRSGRRRRKCIRAIRRRDKVYVVALRPPELAVKRPTAASAWVWNIRANPSVRLHIGLRTYPATAREIDDANELERAREAICETVNAGDFGECLLHLRGLPTRKKIKELHRYWFDTGLPIVVELSDKRPQP